MSTATTPPRVRLSLREFLDLLLGVCAVGAHPIPSQPRHTAKLTTAVHSRRHARARTRRTPVARARGEGASRRTRAGEKGTRAGILAQGVRRPGAGGRRPPEHPPAAVSDAGDRADGAGVVPRAARWAQHGRRALPAWGGPRGPLGRRVPQRTWDRGSCAGAIMGTRCVRAHSSRVRALIDLC